MDFLLHGYAVNDATWFYLSFLLIVAVFFRFGRVWSLRNLDLGLLLLIASGLLLARSSPDDQSTMTVVGYSWLFIVTALLLLRLFTDSLWKRRPLLESNLNFAGMAFLTIAAFTFLMTKVMTEPPPKGTVETVRRAEELLKRQDTTAQTEQTKESNAGPTVRLLAAPVVGTSGLVVSGTSHERPSVSKVERTAARAVAVLAHLAVVTGLWSLGRRLFADTTTGLGMAALYLLLPCTAYEVGKVNHVLPAALIIWSFVAFRSPWIAGALMGLACGSLLFPVFLLPLWAVFYGRQGAGRFVVSLSVVSAVLLASLLFTSADSLSFTRQLLGSIDWSSLSLKLESSETTGFWSTHAPEYRIPVIVAFFVMLLTLTFLPREKNLEHLLGHSTAIVVGTQLWYPQQGGSFVLWYLPLLLAVVFRPRLTSQTPPIIVPAPAEANPLTGSSRPFVDGSWLGRRLR